jgi:hypothetical protein
LVGISAACFGSAFELFKTESKFFEVFTHFSVRDSSVKVLIHLTHQLKHLLLGNRESHSLKHIVELVYFDVVVLVIVYLVKHLLKGEASLLQYLDQVVEYLVLCFNLLPLIVKFLDFIFVVGLVETFELSKFDDAVVV